MSLIYIGIDEAGYGPMLGPLTVAAAAFEVRDWQPGDPAPDLWDLLGKAVGKAARDAPARIPIADSKKTQNWPTPSKPSTRSCILNAVCSRRSVRSTSVRVMMTSLLEALGAGGYPEAPWYRGGPVELPLGTPSGQLGIDTNLLAGACRDAGVQIASLRCRAIYEPAFNEVVTQAGSKAAVTSDAVARFVAAAIRRWGPNGKTPARAIRIVCDRQGGQQDYSDLLRRAAPDMTWKLDARSEGGCRYRAALPEAGPAISTGMATDGETDIGIIFMTEAEAAHLPVGLASMTAKFVRELAMIRFNRYWCARLPELKPTAGYVADARRWLEDVAGEITDADRAAMIRLA